MNCPVCKQVLLFPQCGSTLEGRICSSKCKFFSSRVDLIAGNFSFFREANRKPQKLFPFANTCMAMLLAGK